MAWLKDPSFSIEEFLVLLQDEQLNMCIQTHWFSLSTATSVLGKDNQPMSTTQKLRI